MARQGQAFAPRSSMAASTPAKRRGGRPTTGRPRADGLITLTVVALAASGCGRATAGSGPSVASEAEWRALASPRPLPLAGAPRISVSAVELHGSYSWPAAALVAPSLGVAELVSAGLLRRRDVDFVERRRFSIAAEAERSGSRRRAGQPPAGVSRSVDFSTTAVWIRAAADSAMVEVRLVRPETGDVAGATRLGVSTDIDPVTLARSIVAGAIEVLDDLGRLPEWSDPLAATANTVPPGGVATDALLDFLIGLAAEEGWNWEGARRGYEAAARAQEFHEAATALARAARLRLGGTLAES